MISRVCESLSSLHSGDCVAIVFECGLRRAAAIESVEDGTITCWGYRFQSPDYEWIDATTGDSVRLALPTLHERRDLFRRICRCRLARLDWHSSDQLSDSQLERLVAILDETR